MSIDFNKFRLPRIVFLYLDNIEFYGSLPESLKIFQYTLSIYTSSDVHLENVNLEYLLIEIYGEKSINYNKCKIDNIIQIQLPHVKYFEDLFFDEDNTTLYKFGLDMKMTDMSENYNQILESEIKRYWLIGQLPFAHKNKEKKRKNVGSSG